MIIKKKRLDVETTDHNNTDCHYSNNILLFQKEYLRIPELENR